MQDDRGHTVNGSTPLLQFVVVRHASAGNSLVVCKSSASNRHFLCRRQPFSDLDDKGPICVGTALDVRVARFARVS